jgi:transcriptional regulator with XRE-family HTH domain
MAPVQVRIRATRLAEWRRAQGLTQRELARRLDVSQNYIPALEGGSRDPGPEMRGRLMASLGVSFFELFEVVLVGVADDELHLVPAAAPPVASSGMQTAVRTDANG